MLYFLILISKILSTLSILFKIIKKKNIYMYIFFYTLLKTSLIPSPVSELQGTKVTALISLANL